MKKINFTPQSSNKSEPLEINGHVFTLTNLDPIRLARDTLPKLLESIQILGCIEQVAKDKEDNLDSEVMASMFEAWDRIDEVLAHAHDKLKAHIVDPSLGKDFMEILFPAGLDTNDSINFYTSLITQLSEQ